jgi:hypothetical protein
LCSLIIFNNSSKDVFSETLIPLLACSINLSARNRLRHCLQSINGSEKLDKCPLAFQISLFDKIDESNPTARGFLVTNSLHHKRLMFCFNKTPNGPQSQALANPP